MATAGTASPLVYLGQRLAILRRVVYYLEMPSIIGNKQGNKAYYYLSHFPLSHAMQGHPKLDYCV